MHKSVILIISVLMAIGSQTATAADAKSLSASCVACHGANGISNNPNYPNLAGQKAAYLLKQMRDFKNGTRKDPIMGAMLTALSEQDLDVLANYYSKLK
jgi:cytochrome c553